VGTQEVVLVALNLDSNFEVASHGGANPPISLSPATPADHCEDLSVPSSDFDSARSVPKQCTRAICMAPLIHSHFCLLYLMTVRSSACALYGDRCCA
jgi:hypothetical protein